MSGLIENRYKVLRKMKTGGMGDIFLGRDIIEKRDVVLKMIRDDFCKDLDFRMKFLNEAMICTKLYHPNIVRMNDMIRQKNGAIILVFEYIQGETLRSILMKSRKLKLSVALAISLQIVKALEYAHGMGIVHRDLKPENILLGNNGKIYLIDFGISYFFQSGEDSEDFSGTKHYMAPEQLCGNIDFRSDIYSFGRILSELLTGNAAISFAELENLIDINDKDTKSVVTQVLKKCIAENAEERFKNASELLRGLRKLQEGDNNVR